MRIARDTESALAALAAPGSGLSRGARAELQPLLRRLKGDTAKLPRTSPGDNPVTLGVGEPFTTTLTVSLYFALIISLLAIIMVSIAIAFFIHMADLDLAWCFLIVFGGYLLLAALLGLIGYRKVRRVKAPERTIAEVQETPRALKRG